ncbi:Haemagluttinin repeat-containing protein [Chloroherpeton thalassium ATCC 35110]|uniref:Haemagluttinin repeat-containing protein n=1 Tax=Chloroherpeton thalassium (strain ATCC 35110 / GB-78) TaxID=517418 RepID=B3QVC8_CHLT3|nr:T9SS type A sorting domain-containing protein [Chloroherpeton thalassium]ACF14528.1 Haemagluttinin repeat-containing protein [Chloroherpeton thalassium ATCC 35110]
MEKVFGFKANKNTLLMLVAFVFSMLARPVFAQNAKVFSEGGNAKQDSLYYSPADYVTPIVPLDSTFYVEPIKKSASKSTLGKTMADITWTGAGDGVSWNEGANWEGAVPTSSDNVIIPNGANVQLIDGSNGVCNTLTIENGGSLTVGSKTLTVTGDVDIQSGGSLSNSGTITLGGNWLNSGTLFSNTGSVVQFTSTGDQTIEASSFYDLHLYGTSGTKTALGDLDINGDLRIYQGVSFDPGSHDIYIAESFENDGTLILGTGTFIFDGTVWQQIYSNQAGYAPGTWNFNDIEVTGNAGGIAIYDTLSINGDVTVGSSEYIWLIHYALTNTTSEGIMNGNGGSLTFAANSYIVVRTQMANGAGGADDNFPNNFNTISFATGDNAALCYYRTTDASHNQIIRTHDANGDQIAYGRLRLDVDDHDPSYSSIKSLDGDLNVDQYIYIDSEVTFDVTASNYSINVWGNWQNDGVFDAQGGTVTFDGDYQYIQGDNTTTFNNLVFSGDYGKILQVGTEVSGNCTVSSGVQYLNLQTYTLTGSGASSTLTLNDEVLLYVRDQYNFPDFPNYSFTALSEVRYDRSGDQQIKTGITYGGLYLGNGGGKDFDASTDNLTVKGDLTIASGTTLGIYMPSSAANFTLTLEGDYTNAGTVQDYATNTTFVLSGSDDASFNPGGDGSGQIINNLTVSKSSSATVTLDNNIRIDGDFLLSSGTFGMAAYNRNVTVNGNWTTNLGAEFDHGTGTVYFTGNGQVITANGDGDFWNVDLSGGTKSFGSDVDINNNLIIESDGSLDLNTGNLYLGGSFNNNNGGSFDASNQTVVLDGSSNMNFYIGPNDSLWNLTVNKSGGAYVNYDEHDLKIGGNFSLLSGEMNRGYNSSTSQYTDIIIYGNWSRTGGTFLSNATDTVFFMGATQSIAGLGTDDFANIWFGGGGTKTITANVDADRSINIESGTTVAVSGTKTLKVGRDFINDGTFTCNQSTLVFEEYAGWNPVYLKTNGSSLYNLTLNMYGSGYRVDLSDDLDVNNNIKITQGTLDVTTAGNYDINCGGSWTVGTNGAFNERSGIVTFDGTSTSKTITTNGDNFYRLVFNASNSVYSLNDNLATTEDVLVQNGTLNLNGNSLLVGNGSGDSLVVSDTIIVNENAMLRMASGSQISVASGGYMQVAGAVSNPATVTNQGSGRYAFDIQSGGTIAAEYYTFEFMDTDGLNVMNGALVDATMNFSNGVFTNGASAGTFLTLENNQAIGTVTGVSFPTNPGGTGVSNVKKTVNQGSITFQNASGAFQGESYDNDTYNLINWTYTSTLWTWTGSVSTNWDTPGNWDLGTIPTSSGRVTIPNTTNKPVITSTSDSCYHLTIASGATLTLGDASNVGKLVATGDVTIQGTLTFAHTDDTLKVEGNWSNSGTFTHNNYGAVVFTGSGEQSIYSSGTGKSFSYIVIEKEGGQAVLASALNVNRMISLIDGTLNVSAANYAITVTGSWLKADSASFNAQSGTVTFNQADSTIYGSGTDDFYNLVISANPVILGGSLDISGGLTISSGADLDASSTSYGITILGNWTNNGGTFTAQSGNVIFGGVSQSITGTGTTTFYNLTIESTVTYLSADANVSNTFSLNSGRFELNTSTLTGSGSADLFVMSSSTQLYVEDNNFPSGFENFSLDQTSYVRYRSSGDEDVVGQDASGNQISFGYLYLEVGGTKTAQDDLDVNGSLYIAENVTFDLNSKDVTIELNWDNDQGGSVTNTGSSGTVTLDRDDTQYIYANTTTGDAFPNLVFAGSGAKVLAGNISVTGNLTLNTGVSYLNLQTYTITGTGSSNSFNLSSNVTLYVRGANNFPSGFESFNLAQNSIVRYDASLAQVVTTHDADGDQIQYGYIYFQYNTKTLDGDLNVRDQFYVYGSTTLEVTSANNYNISIGGNYYNLGTINFHSNTVTFDGGDEQIVYSYGTTSAKTFNNLRINKPGGSTLRIYTYDVKVNGDFTFDAGLLANHGRTLTVAGNWTSTSSATMDDRAGNVTFTGSKKVITTGGTADFYDVNFTGSDTTFLGSDIDVLHDLTIGSSAKLDVTENNYKIGILGDYTNNNIFVPRNGLVEFYGTTTQYINTGGDDTDENAFYDLKINRESGYVYLNGNLFVKGNIEFAGSTSAEAQFRMDGNDIEVQGSWLNPKAVYVVPNNGDETVTFSGTSKDTIETGYFSTRPSRFAYLVINHQDSVIHIDDIRVDHGYEVQQGKVYLNGHNFYFGSTYDADENFALSSSNGVALFDIGAGGTLNIRGGNNVNIESSSTDTSVFRMVGTDDNAAEVTYWGNRYYRFNVNSGGRTYARYYRFSGMDSSGVRIDGGVIAGTGADTTEDFSNGYFNLGQNAGRYLYIVNNSQTLQIDSVGFVNSLGASGANVEKLNDAGRITFYNATGEYAGEDYERDTHSRVDWATVFTGITWTGANGTNWHDAGNWSPAQVPTSSDDVTIPNVTNRPLISNNDAVCRNLTIEDVAELQIGNSKDLDVNGGIQINGTLKIFGQDSVFVSGDYLNAGILNAGQSTFIFDGDIQKINSGGITNNYVFYNIYITDTSSVLLEDNVQLSNDLTIDVESSLDVDVDRAIYVKGDWSNSGSLVYHEGTVTFNGESAQSISGSGTNDFYNVYFSASGVKSLSGTINIYGSVRINTGATVNGGSATVNCSSNFYNYGSFDGGSGTFNFNGSGGVNIYGDNIPTFHNVLFSNGGYTTLYTSINVDSLLLVEDDVNYINLQTYSINGTGSNDSLFLGARVRMYVRGSDNFPKNFSAIKLADSSYVRYDASMTQTVRTKTSGGDPFYYGYLELMHISTGSRKVLEGDLYTNNEIQINDPDTLDITSNNYDITCGGRFDLYGYILADYDTVANTLTMNDQVDNYFTSPGTGYGKVLHNIVFDAGDGNTMIFAGSDELICNNITINSGMVNPNGNREITLTGNFIVNGNGEFLPSTSHLIFAGTGDLTLKANGSTLYKVTLDGNGKTVSLGDELNMNSDLIISSGDTLTLNGQTFNFGNGSDAITVNGVLDVDEGAQLSIYNTGTLLVNSGGRLNVLGVSGNTAQLSGANGYYSLEVQGTIAAKYYIFEDMNQQGIYINGGTIDTTNNFSYGTFTNGESNGKFLHINNNTQSLTSGKKIVEVQFPSNPGGTSYNVYVENSASGAYAFDDASGVFAGVSYEYDPDDVVEWTYTTVTRQWTGLKNSDWHTANNWSPQAVPTSAENVIITSKSNLPIISKSSAACKDLTISGGSLTLKNGDTLSILRDITIGSGASFTVSSDSDVVKVQGTWTNSGTFRNGSGTVIFEGSNSQSLSSGGISTGKQFYNLTINKSVSTADLNLADNNLYVAKDLVITQGRLNTGSQDIYVGGDWRNTGGDFNGGTSQVTFVGSEVDTVLTGGSTFYDLAISASSGSVRALDNVRVENDLYINSGTFYVDDDTLSVGSASGDKLSIQGSLALGEKSVLALKGGSDGVAVESGGILQAIGTSSSDLALVTRYGTSGNYPIILNSGGSIKAQYAKFSHTGGSGIWVKSGATIDATDKLHYCVFENGNESSYMQISNSQEVGTISGVTFSSAGTTSPTNNVVYDGTGSVHFNNYTGGLSGARYEHDNGSDPVGNVRWTFTETKSSLSAGQTYTFGNDMTIKINSIGDLSSITVELVDEKPSELLTGVFHRYYDITTVPVSPSGYNVNVKLYYADGTDGTSNEIPFSQSDSLASAWVSAENDYLGPLSGSRSASQNWAMASNVVGSTSTGYLNGIWFISNAQDDAALPVELLSFNLENDGVGVKVTWSTASEVDNLGFILELSTSSDSGFVEVASYQTNDALKGQGTVSVQTNYEYTNYSSFETGKTYYYRLSDVNLSGTKTVLETQSITRPNVYSLEQNYPNPFNPITTIQFNLQKSARTVLEVYDILGRKITTLVNDNLDAGAHVVQWNAKGVASGVYFYRLRSGNYTAVKKMMVLK